ncbi:MAG: DUF2330 domain-containing protein [Pseudomonadota bacterium]|nr:DUF2330 domain-containing protein [Pseudomonadota bacterium]
MTLLSLLIQPALACGGFAPQEGALAASDAQQALFDLGTHSITVTYRAHYQGNAADFAWVVAVPGGIGVVAEGDADKLDAIALASAPQVEIDPASSEGSGCACINSSYGLGDKGGGDNFGDTGVVVTGSGLAGNYTYTTLAASDADGLVTWLTDHGYDVSLIEDAIAGYVADPLDYEFVAVQLAPDAPETAENGVDLAPLSITYGIASDGALHAIFPAKLGASSSVEQVRTEIFVLGEGTATLSGWEAVANPDLTEGNTWDAVGADYWDPAGIYTHHLLGYGGAERRMWLAYAGSYDAGDGARWLTRYDAIVFPSTNSVDPVFTDSTERTPASTVIFLMNETEYERDFPGDTAFMVVGLLGLLSWRRKARPQA